MSNAPLICTVLDDYQTCAADLADWASLAPRVRTGFRQEPLADTTAAAHALAGSDIVVAMRERTPFPATLIEQLPKLKLLVTTGMRNAAIDVAAAKARGITVCGTEGVGRPTSELTWALILASLRHLEAEMANMRAGRWQTTLGGDLFGRTLGLIGLGTVGGQVAAVGKAFGMRVIAWSQNLTPQRCAALGVELASSLDDLLGQADIVSVHLVLSDRSRGLIGARELAAMKPGAVLVNTARGPIVEEAALVTALESGSLASAAVDVYEHEPLPPTHPFRRLSRLVMTPHLGYVTAANYRSHYPMAVADIAAWLDGTPVRVIG